MGKQDLSCAAKAFISPISLSRSAGSTRRSLGTSSHPLPRRIRLGRVPQKDHLDTFKRLLPTLLRLKAASLVVPGPVAIPGRLRVGFGLFELLEGHPPHGFIVPDSR